jgi:hypothetical protein
MRLLPQQNRDKESMTLMLREFSESSYKNLR